MTFETWIDTKMSFETWIDTKMLNLWQHWSEHVYDLLGGEWREDDTEMTMVLLSLFKTGKSPAEAVAVTRTMVKIIMNEELGQQ